MGVGVDVREVRFEDAGGLVGGWHPRSEYRLPWFGPEEDADCGRCRVWGGDEIVKRRG